AEDGIRDDLVTGVQTCALPIYTADRGAREGRADPPAPPRDRRTPLRRRRVPPYLRVRHRPRGRSHPRRRLRLLRGQGGAVPGGEIGRASCRERGSMWERDESLT